MSSSAGYTGYYPSYELSDTENLGDRLSTPVLDPPEWPVDNKLNDAYTNSPLSSPGIYTPRVAGSQDYFDRSFSEALQPSSMTSPSTETLRASSSPYPQTVLQPDRNPNWTPGNSQPAPSYVSLSVIHDPLTRNDDATNLTESPLYSPGLSVTSTGESSPPAAFKRA